MKKISKCILSIILCSTLLSLNVLPRDAHASENIHECEGYGVSASNIEPEMDADLASKPHIIVELENEEDFYSYPINSNYRYTFVVEKPSRTRATRQTIRRWICRFPRESA